MKKLILTIVISFSAFCATAQETNKPVINISGHADIYYGFDFNRPFSNERPDFLFNHTRHNEVNLNLGLIQADIDGGFYRGSLGLMVGTYAQYNLAAEQDLLKNVFEAYAGVAIDKERKLWIDAGIFASHIGFESAISSENFTLTRSLLAENSPYFLSGAKITYTPNSKWEFEAGVFNGWQRIQRLSGNTSPALGTRVTHTPTENLTLNWSTFIGNDFPQEDKRMRYFNNLYAQMQLSQKVALILGFDYGSQQEAIESVQAGASRGLEHWYTPIGILRVDFNENWGMAFRGEYYQDQNGVIIEANSPDGFRATGYSINLDRKISQNVLFRIEARQLQNSTPNFLQEGQLVRGNFLLIGSLAITLP
ncbi:porin [Mongoliitalea daihaiensis]|uniref:porin n=1 Tax=Mongoliitalea daihaiensis TaxID=2782006 RepID=UPI001F4835BC|nr:porin [Mongoliitalea daihaiensis]UJP63951.1 porin [Mongoliitalea daihaiensis]